MLFLREHEMLLLLLYARLTGDPLVSLLSVFVASFVNKLIASWLKAKVGSYKL